MDEQVIYAIIAAYNGITANDITNLVTATDKVTGVGMARINGYRSAKSNGTELSNYTINIGASYANMIVKDSNIYANFDLSQVDVNKFAYENCILTGVLVANPNHNPTDKKSKAKMRVNFANIEEFKTAVIAELPNALQALQEGKTRENDTTADIWINKALVFNTNSKKLSLYGMLIGDKNIVEKGEYEPTATAPLTVAKKLISKQANGRTQTLRRFNMDRICNNVRLSNTEIVIEQRENEDI